MGLHETRQVFSGPAFAPWPGLRFGHHPVSLAWAAILFGRAWGPPLSTLESGRLQAHRAGKALGALS
jgi:hypothetical protein